MKTIFFALPFLLISLSLSSQTNFSGKWEFDKIQSSKDLTETGYNGSVILNITHDGGTIGFSETWKSPGNDDFNTSVDSYKLDGREYTRKSDVGTNKQSAKWSKDKRILIIKNLDTQDLKGVLQDFLVEDSYSLSDDGKTLILDGYSKNPVTGETRSKKIYHKL